MKIIINLLVTALAVFVSAYIVPGISVDSYWIALLVAVVLGLINAFLRPLLIILTLPINILTLGLFTFVINALMIMLAGSLVSGFTVDGFWSGLLFALILGVINGLFGFMKK